MKYSLEISFEADEEKLTPLYKSPKDPGEKSLIQEIYELASKVRDQGIDFSWKERSEVWW